MTELVRKAAAHDLPELLEIYEEARAFMVQNDNPTQWGKNRYPPAELIEKDIRLSRLYVLERGGRVCGAFVLMAGDEPTYRVIERGAWPNQKPYLTVHRLASRTDEHGVGMAVLAFAAEEAEKAGLALRADTHADNKPVQHLLKKFGFEYCGVIRVANGSERYAYQWEG